MTKFWMITHRSESTTTVMFAREDNGMILGATGGDGAARFGEDPQEIIIRVFMDHDSAVAWLKQKCREYAGREDVDFLTKEGNPQIVVPRGGMPATRRM